MKSKLVVYAAFPYGNGPLHFGRIGGSFLPADIYVRFKRLIGTDCIFVSATDCYGSPIVWYAEKEKVNYEQFVGQYHIRFIKTLSKWGIVLDSYNKTHNSVHIDFVQKNLLKLQLTPAVIDRLFCVTCNKLLNSRMYSGVCYNCNAQINSEVCENCNTVLIVKKLTLATCNQCGAVCTHFKDNNYVIDLQEYRQDFFKHFKEPLIKTTLIKFYNSDQNLTAFKKPVLRKLQWGVPSVLIPDYVVYVWIQALCGYLSFTQHLVQPSRIHFIGVDNIYYHTVVYGTILKRLNEPLPTLFVRRWFLLNESKQSSSRQNYLDLYEWELTLIQYDICRAYVVSVDTLSKENNLSTKNLIVFSKFFVDYIHNTYYRLLKLAQKYQLLGDMLVVNTQLAPEYIELMNQSNLAKCWQWLMQKYNDVNKQLQTSLNYKVLDEHKIKTLIADSYWLLIHLSPICPRYYLDWATLLAYNKGTITLKEPFILKPFLVY